MINTYVICSKNIPNHKIYSVMIYSRSTYTKILTFYRNNVFIIPKRKQSGITEIPSGYNRKTAMQVKDKYVNKIRLKTRLKNIN